MSRKALAIQLAQAAALLAGIFWLISQARPPQLLVTLGEQQAVRTANPIAGVHTRFVDEVEEWKIKRGLEMAREMGAGWVVEFFPWAYYEGRQGARDFSGADRIVDHANRQGLKVIARLGFVPAWARPKTLPDGRPTTFTHLDPEHYADFAAFAAAFAAHFRGRITQIVIWNEPNLSGEWGLRPVDPAAYARMLQVVYPAIKQANPDAQVLAGALAPTLETDRNGALNDLVYLEEMYAALEDGRPKTADGLPSYVSRPFDGISMHSYGRNAPPDEAPAPDRINFRRTELLREVMLKHGDTAPVFITEAGWNDDPRWVFGVSPAQRIAYTLGAWDYARAHWDYVRCVAMWVYKLPAPENSYRDHFQFITPGLEPLPIYEEAKRHLVDR
ncbi:MAG TPA: beta-galactosidase [Thermoflexales bacterium]|nr:beta-galactosidase [Thermoflexales bacterium]